MTRFTVVMTKSALADLKKIDRSIQQRIVAKLEDLAEDPLRKVRRLVNSPYYRLRVGDWRIIVAIEESTVTVFVLHVGHRRSAYR